MSSLDQLAIDTIRTLSMDAVQAANSGHPGTPMALAPLGWLLYSKLMRHDPAQPQWPGRDRFVLSCGHASMLQYSLLHLSGYDLSIDDLKAFRQWGSKTPGHPEVFHTPGVETTTGPLGQGVANAVGMAMAQRHMAARFGESLFGESTIWVIASDGDLMEGVASEAASLAGHLKLKSLVVFWDDNSITIDGRTTISFTEDVVARFAAYGWDTYSVEDGNDLAALEAAALAAKASDRPSFIRVKTIIGDPSPGKRDTSSAHGSPLGAAEIEKTKAVMGWDHPPFYVPPALSEVKAELLRRGQDARAQWEAALSAAGQDTQRDLHAALSGELPEGWERALPQFEVDPKGMATRAASGKLIVTIAEQLEGLIGGSADLAASNKTHFKAAAFGEGAGVPRVVHFGIREHAMGAIQNGMALYGGVIPMGATFLVFADYMRPAIRMAALMGLRTRYVFTHDSIGLGEDGPTHQPIETLASLRAIPGLLVLRPADANETREAWIAALRHDGPAALVLTRHDVPTIDMDAAQLHRGVYIARDAAAPKALIAASGSELSIALEAATLLEGKGVPTRVLSVPAWELIDSESAKLFDLRVPVRAVIEAGVSQGWHQFIGSDAIFVTMERFGASAPYEILYKKFGLSAAALAQACEAKLAAL